jgi:hypothetical protein
LMAGFRSAVQYSVSAASVEIRGFKPRGGGGGSDGGNLARRFARQTAVPFYRIE